MFPTENNVQWQATQPSRLKLWNGYLAARISSQPKLGFLSESIVRILEQKIIFTENCGAQDRPKPIWYICFLTLLRKRSSILYLLFVTFEGPFLIRAMDTTVSGLQSAIWRNLTWKLLRCVVMGASGGAKRRSLISGIVPCLHLSGRPARQNVSSFNFIII